MSRSVLHCLAICFLFFKDTFTKTTQFEFFSTVYFFKKKNYAKSIKQISLIPFEKLNGEKLNLLSHHLIFEKIQIDTLTKQLDLNFLKKRITRQSNKLLVDETHGHKSTRLKFLRSRNVIH
jgi:hypothetical protein